MKRTISAIVCSVAGVLAADTPGTHGYSRTNTTPEESWVVAVNPVILPPASRWNATSGMALEKTSRYAGTSGVTLRGRPRLRRRLPSCISMVQVAFASSLLYLPVYSLSSAAVGAQSGIRW